MRSSMKKTLLLFLFVLFVTNFIHAVPFQNNSIVVVRVGDGVVALSSLSVPVFLDEYNTVTGALIQSIPMPTTVSGANKRLELTGSSTSEGFITMSTDRNYLVLSGYDAATGTTGVAATTSAAVNRVVARIDLSGNIDVTTALTDAFSAANPRGVVSVDGSAFWMTGSGGGCRYATYCATPLGMTRAPAA